MDFRQMKKRVNGIILSYIFYILSKQIDFLKNNFSLHERYFQKGIGLSS
jgi:hypothetical protein